MIAPSGTLRGIARNFLAKTAAEVGTRLLSVLFFMVVARVLAPEGFGKFTFAYALVTVFGAALDLGLHPLFIREVARDPAGASRQWRAALTFKLGLAGPIALALLVIPLATGRPWDTTLAVYLLTAYVLLQSFVELVVAVFTAFGRLEYELVLRLFGKLVLLGLGGLALWAGWHLLGLAAAYVVATALTLALGLRLVARRFGALPLGWAGADAWRLAGVIWPVALAFVLAIAARRVAPLAVALLRGETEVGFFGAAARIVEALDLVPAAFAAVIFPVLASADPAGARFRRTLAQAVQGLLIASLPLALILTVGAGPLTTLFYGEAYAPSVLSLQLLGWSMPFGFLNYFFIFTFLALNRPGLLLGLAASGLGVSLVLTPALVTRWGAAGGSLGVVVSDGVLACLGVLALGTVARPVLSPWTAVKPFLAGLAAAATLPVAGALPPTARLPLALAVYGAGLVALRIPSREEWGLLRALLFARGGNP